MSSRASAAIPPVVIAGGGVGGLTLAALFRQRGIAFRLIDPHLPVNSGLGQDSGSNRTDASASDCSSNGDLDSNGSGRSVGGGGDTAPTTVSLQRTERGLGIWPEARAILRRMGVWDGLDALRIPSAGYRDQSGAWLSQCSESRENHRRVGSVRESVLLAALLDAAGYNNMESITAASWSGVDVGDGDAGGRREKNGGNVHDAEFVRGRVVGTTRAGDVIVAPTFAGYHRNDDCSFGTSGADLIGDPNPNAAIYTHSNDNTASAASAASAAAAAAAAAADAATSQPAIGEASVPASHYVMPASLVVGAEGMDSPIRDGLCSRFGRPRFTPEPVALGPRRQMSAIDGSDLVDPPSDDERAGLIHLSGISPLTCPYPYETLGICGATGYAARFAHVPLQRGSFFFATLPAAGPLWQDDDRGSSSSSSGDNAATATVANESSHNDNGAGGSGVPAFSRTPSVAERDHVLRAYSGFHSEVCEVLEEALGKTRRPLLFEPARQLPRSMVYYGDDEGARNRLLIGDACHGCAANLAQGASVAIEDAYVLARIIEEQGGGPFLAKAGAAAVVAENFADQRVRRAELLRQMTSFTQTLGSAPPEVRALIALVPRPLNALVFDTSLWLALGAGTIID